MTRKGAARGLLLSVLAVVLAACSATPVPPPVASQTPSPTPPSKPTQVVVAVDDLGPGFNPHLLADLSPVTTALATLVLPSVFRPDASGVLRLDPTVATSAKVVSFDPFTVSYELNLEASWSSNAPIAAEDFVYLWQRMRSEPGVSDGAGYRMITDVRSRAGGKAVDVVFAEPYPGWRHLFSDLLPAHILKDAPGSWTGALTGGLPVSGGPFRVDSVDRARGEIVLVRNDLYWDTPAVLDQLVLRRLDVAAMAAELAAGDVDIALPGAAAAVRLALAGVAPGLHTQAAPRPSVTQLGLRADAGPLADPRVRQGIAAIVDREAIRAAVAPDALVADTFGTAPSEPGYAPTTPSDRPVRPDPAVAARLLAEAGWTRDGTERRWTVAGQPVRLVVGAAAERPQDVTVARLVATQLEAAGIGAFVVAPAGTELFGRPTVSPTPPSTTPSVPTSGPAPSGPSTTSPTPTTATVSPAGGVRVDVMVTPRAVGGDPAAQLSSDYGCPAATPAVRVPPPSPTGFCFAPLQPLLDALLSRDGTGDAGSEVGAVTAARATVERVLWAQMPALPLFQPVSLVVSTPGADTTTRVGPGPLATGPLTGAQRWAEPAG